MSVFCTEYQICGDLWSDLVEADSWEEAQRICNGRRPHSSEIVTGQLMEEIPVDDAFMICTEVCLN